MTLESVYRRLDILALGGVHTVLGIEISSASCRIAEVRRRGSPLNKFRSSFELVNSCEESWDNECDVDRKVVQLREIIRRHGFKSTSVVAALGLSEIKTVQTTISQNVENKEEWIHDLQDKLLRLPVPHNEVHFRYEQLARNRQEDSVEVVFARTTVTNEYESLFAKAGLKLLSIGPGSRDAINAILIARDAPSEFNLLYVGDEFSVVTHIRDGKRVDSREIFSPLANSRDLTDVIGDDSFETLVAGDVTHDGLARFNPVEALGAPATYTLSIGLAIKGFLPELSPTSFLSASGAAAVDTQIQSAMAKRLTFALGSMLLVFLLIPFVASILLHSAIGNAEEQYLETAPARQEIERLTEEVVNLERSMNGSVAAVRRSALAKTLHDIAGSIPDGVWLYKIRFDESTSVHPVVVVFGYTAASASVAAYLRSLRARHICSNIQLERSGQKLDSEPVLPASLGSTGLTFMVKGELEER